MIKYSVDELIKSLPPAPLSPEKTPKNHEEKVALWAKVKEYFVKQQIYIVEDGQDIDRLIDAGARLNAHLKQLTNEANSSSNFDIAVEAALEKFEQQLPTDCFGSDQMNQTEIIIRKRLNEAKLEAANSILSRQQKRRKLTYRDLGFIFLAHRKNTLHNENGASPYSGLVALSVSGAGQGLIAASFDHRQIAMALTLVEAIGLTRAIEPPNKDLGRCGRWEILWHPNQNEAKEKPTHP